MKEKSSLNPIISSIISILDEYRIREHNGSYAKAARALGLNVGNGIFRKWLEGERVPSLSGIAPALEKLGVQITLPVPSNAVMHRMGEYAPLEKVEGEQLCQIPVFEHAGAGESMEFFSLLPEMMLPVLPQYYMPEVRALKVTGDSMEPTIKKGAYVGVIPLSGTLEEGGIYLVRRPPFGLVVKRIRQGENGEIILHSDNPEYKPQVIINEGYEDIIAGKVVWVWQTF